MKNSKRKHYFLMLILFLTVVFCVRYMMVRANVEKRNSVAIVLPRNEDRDYSRVLDGIRDYALNNEIVLDVWYKDTVSLEELESLIANAEKNKSMGILLVYPEEYISRTVDETYHFEHVLAITDTMSDCFLHTATFEKQKEKIYSIPVSAEVIGQLTEDKNQFIFVGNTYKLGYSSMEMMQESSQSGSMEDVCLACMKVDKTTLESGDIDSLLVE